MHGTGYGSLAMVLTAGALVAGCGGTTNRHTATPPGNAGQSAGASVNPYGHSSGGATSSSATGSGGQSAVTISTKKHGDLGTIVTYGPKRLTAYLFQADTGGHSSCNGACARFWPPVTGTPKPGAGAVAADLGTITRSNGIKQVTYKGHPLYGFVQDKDDGDAYGEGQHAFGADWYVLTPAGSKVDKS